MSYRFEAGRLYRMPTHFGPTPGPRQLPPDVVIDRKLSPRLLSVTASFLTDPKLLDRHLPEGFTLAGEPVVTVEFHHMTDIDWLAGRSYAMIWVSWPATFTGRRRKSSISHGFGRTSRRNAVPTTARAPWISIEGIGRRPC